MVSDIARPLYSPEWTFDTNCIRSRMDPQIWPRQFVELFENRTRTLGYSAATVSTILTELPHLHYKQTTRRHMPEANITH